MAAVQVRTYMEPQSKITSRGGFRKVNEDRTNRVKQQQTLANQFGENADAKIDELFAKYDKDRSGYVSLKELEEGLLASGVKLSKPNWALLQEAFPYSSKSSKNQFRDIMKFFNKVKQNFSKYDADSSNTINAKELPQFLSQFSFNFDQDVLKKLMGIWDADSSGELSFSETVELVLYLEKLSRVFTSEDKDRSGILEPAELQCVLRTLNVPVSVLELKVFLQRQGVKADNMNFANFVSLLFDVKTNLESIRKEAEEVRSKQHSTKNTSGRAKKSIKLTAAAKSFKKHSRQQNELLEKLKKQCQSSGKKWEDPDFPANGDLMFPTVKRGAQAIKSWKRIEDFQGGQLFVEGVDQGDVKQGALGDCWFLSSLCVLAGQGPDSLKNLFVNVSPKEGIVQCRFYKDSEWKIVTIDDRIPCGANGLPCFASCRDPVELWVPLIEKAYAKLHGNFEAIESGSITDGLVDLTGEGSEVMDIGKTPDFWKMLETYCKEGFLMGCAAQAAGAGVEEATPLGILMLHAYGILNAVEADGNKLICIRNPWGRHEWLGRWSDNSKEWTPSLMKKLNITFEDDGVFWMDFSDFSKHFNKLYVLRALTDSIGHIWKRSDFADEWKGESAGGCLNNPTWSKNPQFRVKCPTESKVFVSLRQPDLRVIHKKTPTYKAIGFAVLVKGDSNDTKKTNVTRTDLVTMSAFFAGREISSEFTAKAGVDYIVIPSFFDKGVESSFFLSLYTHDESSQVFHIGKPSKADSSDSESDNEGASEPSKVTGTLDPHTAQAGTTSLTLSSSWVKGKTSGGCPVNTSWKTSPQFILELPAPDKVSITIKQKTKTTDNKYHHVGFFVFKSEAAKKRKFTPSDIVFQTEFLNSVESGAEVDLPAGTYNILVSTYHPDLEGMFDVTVKGRQTRNPKQFYELTSENDWKTISLRGGWIPGKDGGCSNNQTSWMNNPRFDLQVGEDSILKVVVDAENLKCAVGFYIFNTTDGKTPSGLNTVSAFVQPSNLEHTIVTKDIELKQGKYIVMPSTYLPNVHTNFVLSVHSDHQKLSLTAL